MTQFSAPPPDPPSPSDVSDIVSLSPENPLDLLGSGDAFVVVSGAVYLFVQKYEEGSPVGDRIGGGIFEAGAIVFGFPEIPDGLHIETSSEPDTGVIRFTRQDIHQAFNAEGSGQLRDGITEGIGKFVEATSKALMIERNFGRSESLELGKASKAIADTTLLSKKLVWVRPQEAIEWPLAYADSEGAPARPISRLLIATTSREVEIDPMSTEQLAVSGGLDSSLDALVLALAHSLRERCESRQLEFASRLEHRDVIENRQKHDLFQNLVRASDGKDPIPIIEASDTPIEAASRRVAALSGVRVPASLVIQPRRWISPPEAVARSAKCRVRKIKLPEKWWHANLGPFLGRMKDGRPVSFQPDGKSFLAEIFDDGGRSSQLKLTTENLAEIELEGWQFLPSLPPKIRKKMQLLNFVFRGAGRDFGVILLASFVVSIVNLIVPFATGSLVQVVIPDANTEQLFILILVLVSAAFSIASFNLVQSLAIQRMESRATTIAPAAILDRLLGLPSAFLRKYQAGDLARRVISAEHLRTSISVGTIRVLTSMVFAGSYLIFIFSYSWRFGLLALGVMVFAILVSVVSYRVSLQQMMKAQKSSGFLDSILLEYFTGIAKLRTAAAEVRAFRRWSEAFGTLRQATVLSGKIKNAVKAFEGSLPLLGMLAAYWLQGHLMEQSQVLANEHQGSGAVSPGMFLAIYSALAACIATASSMGASMQPYMSAYPIYKRIKPIIDAVPMDASVHEDPGVLAGNVTVSHVTFSYVANKAPVLNDVSIEAGPGEFIAIVGSSGSGKTSLMKVMLGLESPQRGDVYFDGRSVNRLDPVALRRQIGTVTQDTRILGDSVISVIRGFGEYTMEEAWNAVRLANAEDDIRQMPMGMHTVIDTSLISGGQLQRILMARALISGPAILVLDEATSALDETSQRIVMENLDVLNATRIVVAHRLSTIAKADRIYVMDKGQIVQQGTFDELIEQDGQFKVLASRQMI
jgi:NHLM bacteriocin system ABC transporter ATP-binding protein